MADESDRLRQATLGGGCFWCVEAAFKEMAGVVDVESGYAGGARANPTYAQVCSGATGHAEVVRLVYDPELVSFEQLLDLFFAVHDPTQRNRQGNDVGTQYRSVIFHHDDEQKAAAERKIRELDKSGRWGGPLVTEVSPLPNYYPAEDAHQDYFEKHPEQPYCQIVVAPKVDKARKLLGKD